MPTELPKSLEDEFARLAAMPGDDDVILPQDDDQPETPSAETSPATAAAPAPAKVNLDDFEDFRKYKSERDRKESDLQKRLADYERQAEEQRRAAEAARIAQLTEQFGYESDDNARARLLDEAAALKGRAYYEQWQRWEAHKRDRIAAEGLDVNDPRFQKQYSGQQGAYEFERDLLAAAKDKYQREAAELKQQVAPATIEALVKKELAKLAQAQGLNYADTGEQTTAHRGPGAIEQALDDFNMNRISYQEFQRRTTSGRS